MIEINELADPNKFTRRSKIIWKYSEEKEILYTGEEYTFPPTTHQKEWQPKENRTIFLKAERKENKTRFVPLRVSYSENILENKGKIKTFSDTWKPKNLVAQRPARQQMLKDNFQTEA